MNEGDKDKITFIFNILLFIFFLTYFSFGVFTKILFEDVSELDEVALIDKIFNISPTLGLVSILGIIVFGIIFLFLQAVFIKAVWNRLFVNHINGLREIGFQGALTISIILAFLIEFLTI